MAASTYLSCFEFPSEDSETDYLWENGPGNGSFYPFKVLSARGLKKIDFEPITILYGGNGSGKSTALHIIAEKLDIQHDSIYNKSNYFPDYIHMCKANIINAIPENSRIITSDDVFDYMLNIRSLNEGIDIKREVICGEYLDVKYSRFQLNSIEDYDKLKRLNKARNKTQTQFVKSELINNAREYSNGENAFRYFTEKIGENGLYILDEPENSLSPKRQLELKRFIEDSVRFFGCQFIISTHSPFLLAMPKAKIYDLDESPATVKGWTKLENIRIYRDFFKANDNEF